MEFYFVQISELIIFTHLYFLVLLTSKYLHQIYELESPKLFLTVEVYSIYTVGFHTNREQKNALISKILEPIIIFRKINRNISRKIIKKK